MSSLSAAVKRFGAGLNNGAVTLNQPHFTAAHSQQGTNTDRHGWGEFVEGQERRAVVLITRKTAKCVENQLAWKKIHNRSNVIRRNL